MKSIILSLALFLFSAQSFSQEVKTLSLDENPGKGKVSELDWLSGYWLGTGLGGECEEVWLPQKDGQMMGTFRFWNNGKLQFTEFFQLVEVGDSFTLKLKHYGADLSPWEENEEWTEFRLIEVGENKVWLDGLTMERVGDQMSVWVLMRSKNGDHVEKFEYQKGDF
ncbi:DUF6265 family protein [Algoriphagus algorifonticola]|uniref:DUF6265 family protein n=1 Tax=Algoriphagus algorifonticola TaxID=2593007 RepID=UPI0011A5F18B|nr:DUF6265 family protein [Algoriphagus algorifonticola]